MASAEIWLWVGVAAGCLGGLAGGVYGTWRSVRAAQSDEERAFLIRVSVWTFVWVLGGLGVMWLVPQPWRVIPQVALFVPMPWMIRFINRRQQEIRERQSGMGRK